MDNEGNITVIVPLFHGSCFIPNIIRQVESAARKVENDVTLLLISDDPADHINEFKSDDISIITFNTDVNRGIQGARLFGLSKTESAYILFLDQDDKIDESYFKSQLSAVGDNDAVVCSGMNGNLPIYSCIRPFEDAISYTKMLEAGNQIISPGQVLIRKRAIPGEWVNGYRLVFNGVDDWLLWLLMMKKGSKFVLNYDDLFVHSKDCGGYSLNEYKMMCSESEGCCLIENSELFSEDEKRKIHKYIENLASTRQDAKNRKLKTYENLLDMGQNAGNCLQNILNKGGIKSIAIYGLGFLGEKLVKILARTDIEVICAIDNGRVKNEYDFEIYKLGERIPCVDAVLITLCDGLSLETMKIAQYIYVNYKLPCVSLSKLICDKSCNPIVSDESYA